MLLEQPSVNSKSARRGLSGPTPNKDSLMENGVCHLDKMWLREQ